MLGNQGPNDLMNRRVEDIEAFGFGVHRNENTEAKSLK